MGRRSRGLIGDVRMVGTRRRVAEIASKKTTVYGEFRCAAELKHLTFV